MQNHIGRALWNLQGTVRDISSEDARRRLDEARMGLMGSELQNKMYRQSVEDQRYNDQLAYSRGRDAVGDIRYKDETAFNRKQAEAANTRADAQLDISRANLGLARQRQQDERNRFERYERPGLEQMRMHVESANAPATAQDLTSNIPHIAAMWKENGFDQQALRFLNATVDANGNLVYKDGKPVPRHMLEDPNIKRLKAASINPVENAYFTHLRIQDKIDKGEPLSEKETNLYNRYSNATPEQNIKAMMSHVANLEQTIEAARASGVDDDYIKYLEQKKAESQNFANAMLKGTEERQGKDPRQALAETEIKSAAEVFMGDPEGYREEIERIKREYGLNQEQPQMEETAGIDPNNITWD